MDPPAGPNRRGIPLTHRTSALVTVPMTLESVGVPRKDHTVKTCLEIQSWRRSEQMRMKLRRYHGVTGKITRWLNVRDSIRGRGSRATKFPHRKRLTWTCTNARPLNLLLILSSYSVAEWCLQLSTKLRLEPNIKVEPWLRINHVIHPSFSR
jgi:hypothetical protein